MSKVRTDVSSRPRISTWARARGATLVSLAALTAGGALAACGTTVLAGGGSGSGDSTSAASGSGFGGRSAGSLGCVAGQPGPMGPTSSELPVAEDDTYLYLSTQYGAQDLGWSWDLTRMPKDGGDLTPVASGLGFLSHVAVDEQRFYLQMISCDGSDPCSSELRSLPRGGGPETLLFSGVGSAAFTAADPDRIYVVTGDGHQNTALWVPKGGGAPTILASGAGSGDPGTEVMLVADADRLYWYDGAAILSTPKSGDGPTITVTPVDGLLRLLADAENLYWSGGEPGSDTYYGSLFSVPKTGGTPTRLARTEGPMWDVTLDDHCFYWSQNAPGSAPSEYSADVIVAAMSKAGGSTAIVDTGKVPAETGGQRLTVDGSGLYVATPAATTPADVSTSAPPSAWYQTRLEKIPR